MSTAIHSAIALGEGVWALPFGGASGRSFARRICQAMVLLPLFSLVLLPEYVQGVGDPETKSIVYRATLGPLRLVDLLLLVLIVAHVMVWVSSRQPRVSVPRSLVLPGVGFLSAIALAMIYGRLQGGVNLFFDWRALALGVGLFVVFATWIQKAEDVRAATILFAGYMAVRIGVMFANYIRGGGDVLVGVRIPVYDGPTLSAMVFTAVLALWMSDAASGRWQKLWWTVLSGAAYLLVLLCFRRTFWAELGIATALLLIVQTRQRGQKLLLALGALIVVATMVGPVFYERIQSMDFTTDESEFSQGNPDHVGEVLDAWEQVERHPVMGLGLGRSFRTLRIQEWKEESVMVHNAPLHVWLKYGLLGLVCYVWFHFAVFRWLYRRMWVTARLAEIGTEQSNSGAEAAYLFIARDDTAEAVPFHREARQGVRQSRVRVTEAWTGAALVYLAAQFVVSLGFTPWPYSSLQSTTLIAFVLAMAMTGTTPCRFQRFP